MLRVKNVEALNDRQSGIDHGRKLPGKNDDIMFFDLRLEKGNVFKKVFRFFLDFGYRNPLANQLSLNGCLLYTSDAADDWLVG